MLQVAVGHSNDPDSRYAVAEVLEQCRKSLVGNQPKAGILFAAIDFDHSLILDEINCAFPGITLIGGTTDGELSSILEFQQDSLSLMLFCSDDIEITSGIGRGVSKDAIAAASETVKMAKANVTKEPKFCLAKPVGKGTGMGLSISHQIITINHGGELFCTSSLGKGTEFIIQIPINMKRNEIF